MDRKLSIKFLIAGLLLVTLQNAKAQVDVGRDSIPGDSVVSRVDSVTLKKKQESDIKSPIKYSAKDSMMFSVRRKMIFAYGDSKLGMEDMQLDAGYIEMNMDSNYLFARALGTDKGDATGIPVFKQGEEKYTIKTIKYNFKSKKGIVSDVITEQGGGYLHAKTTKLQPNKEFHIAGGKFTTCDAEHPHFYMSLSKAKVIPEKKIISGPFYFVISDIPLPIGLPFGYFPNQKNRTSGIIMPGIKEEEIKGFGIERGGYYFALSDNIDLTVLGELWTSGSWGLDLLSNYKKKYKYGGNFNISYKEVITGQKGLDDYTKNTTFWVRLSYARDSKASPTTSFNTNLNFGSSKYRRYEYSDIQNAANNNASSSIAFTKTWPGTPFNFSANMSATQNLSTNMVSLEMPTIAFNMNKQFPFKRKTPTGKKRWYEDINVGFSSNLKNSLNIADSMLFTGTAVNEMKNGMQYRVPVSTSLKVMKYLNLSPSFSFTGRLYSSYMQQNPYEYEIVNGDTTAVIDTIRGLGHVYDFSFSAPLSTKLYGLVQFKKGKIAAIRHVMSPAIGFSFRPDFGQEKWGFYEPELYDSTGRELFSIYSGGIYGTAPTGKSGSLSFSLDNNFEMKTHSKDTTEKFRKIVLLQSLRISTSYNLAADSLNWAPVSLSANTKILKQINVTYSANIDLYTVDSKGKFQNQSYLNKHRVIGNLSRSSLTLSGSIGSETFKKKNDKLSGQDQAQTNVQENENALFDDNPLNDMQNQPMQGKQESNEPAKEYPFSIPWNINMNYTFSANHNSFNQTTQKFETKTTQTLNLSTNFSLTQKWKIGGNFNFDLQAKKLVQTSWNIYRDLHCWEMSFNFVPFGTWQSYSFRINIKSSLFQGLEYKRTDSWHDNIPY